MSLIVTGANGFLGSTVVQMAAAAGLPVRASDRAPDCIVRGVDYRQADILSEAGMRRVMEGGRYLLHAAGLAHVFHDTGDLNARMHAVNVAGAENAARAAIAAGVRQIVFVSSVSVYGGVSKGKGEEAECRPESPYAKSKLTAERRLTELCRTAGVPLCILRMTTVYGEGDPGNMARLIQTIKSGRFVWVGKGENQKSLIHKEDAARACIKAVLAPAPGTNIYNVASNACVIRDIVTLIAKALGTRVPRWHLPLPLALGTARFLSAIFRGIPRIKAVHQGLSKWAADDYYSARKFQDRFGYRTEVGLEQGIGREVEWLTQASRAAYAGRG